MCVKVNPKWIAFACAVGAVLIGAWIGAQVSAASMTEAEWIEAIQSVADN
jgi:hypothetical protein